MLPHQGDLLEGSTVRGPPELVDHRVGILERDGRQAIVAAVVKVAPERSVGRAVVGEALVAARAPNDEVGRVRGVVEGALHRGAVVNRPVDLGPVHVAAEIDVHAVLGEQRLERRLHVGRAAGGAAAQRVELCHAVYGPVCGRDDPANLTRSPLLRCSSEVRLDPSQLVPEVAVLAAVVVVGGVGVVGLGAEVHKVDAAVVIRVPHVHRSRVPAVPGGTRRRHPETVVVGRKVGDRVSLLRVQEANGAVALGFLQ